MTLTIAHVSDFHVAADPSFRLYGEDPRTNLAAVVEQLAAEPRPDLVLVGGDVSHDGSQASYDFVGGLFARLSCPVLATPGNHENAERLARLFPDADPAVDELLAGTRSVLQILNSQIPGSENGHLPSVPERSVGGDELVILLFHHDLEQPDAGGRPGMVAPADELAKVLTVGRPTLVLTGHRHMATDVSIGGLRILGAPATSTQFVFTHDQPQRAPNSVPAHRVLTLDDGRVTSTSIVETRERGSRPTA